MSTFRVAHIDHVELSVTNQYEAAAWYEKILGLEIVKPFEHWAQTGPLMISSDDGRTMLALFEGDAIKDRVPVGMLRVAFRVNGANFNAFLDHIDDEPVYNPQGKRITRTDVVDHGKSFSIYFADPDGNRLEVTTYEVEAVQR